MPDHGYLRHVLGLIGLLPAVVIQTNASLKRVCYCSVLSRFWVFVLQVFCCIAYKNNMKLN